MTRRPAARSAARSGKSAAPAAKAKPAPAAKPAISAKAKATTRTEATAKGQATAKAQETPATKTETKAKPPATLRVAASVQALEAVGMCVATVYSAAATISGKSYQTASGIALTLIVFGTAVGLALIASGIARARPWSRTPALLTQLFAGGAGVYLLDGNRPEWGVPALILAATGFIGLLAPDSFKALTRGR